ncbi:hypothetical protein BH23PLA1_BH23PLA1_08380 [soil metagenome]
MIPSVPQLGGPAPDFNLPCTTGKGSGERQAALSDSRGRWLVLIFYPRDFSLVCPTELTGLGERIEEFQARDCDLIGISTDLIARHEEWLDTPRASGGLDGLPFPLASDEDARTCRAYGVYSESGQVALRGLFLIDPEGALQYQVVHGLSVGRRADEVLRVLAALQTGGLCPQDWEIGSELLDPSLVLAPGRIFSHYRIEAKLGEGSFATVFRARDTLLHRTVALKVFKPGKTLAPATVLAEARAAAALNHPNVCTLYAVDDSEGVPIIAMEYLKGETMETILAEGPMPLPRVVDLGRQVASAVAAAHEVGVVHGDLKPQNIMVTDEGVAKVLDFGLSRRVEAHPDDPYETLAMDTQDSAEASGLFGTPSYMAPEQTRGETASPASDVFTMGALIYEMVTGRRAFPGTNILQVLEAVRSVRPGALADDMPASYASMIRRSMAPDPALRDITMREIAEQLIYTLQDEDLDTVH